MHYPQGHYIRMALPPKRRKKNLEFEQMELDASERMQ
jgi:hypothetical protein